MRQNKKLEGLGPDGDLEITIKEASVDYIFQTKNMSIFGDASTDEEIKEKGLLSVIDMVKPVYEELTEGLPFEKLQTLFPSELNLIWETFKEVNAVFFEVVQKLGLKQFLDAILQEIKGDFSNIFAEWSKGVIQTSMDTESDGS